MRPRDRPSGGGNRRRRRRHAGVRGTHRRADARRHRPVDACGITRRPGAQRGRATPRRPRPDGWDEAARRLVRAAPRRGAWRRRPRGAGPGRAVRHPCGLGPSERRRAAGRRQARVVPPSGRRHPCRARLRRRRPRRSAPAAALGAGEHRAAVRDAPSPLGPDQPRTRGQGRQWRDRDAPDRHPRGARGPSPVGRQPAEGDDRALGGGWRADDALLRPHARHRHPDEEPDLCPAAGPGGGGCRGPDLHVRAQGDPARLRPGDRHLRGTGRRRARRRRRRRAGPVAGGLQPEVGRADARGDRSRGRRRGGGGVPGGCARRRAARGGPEEPR